MPKKTIELEAIAIQLVPRMKDGIVRIQASAKTIQAIKGTRLYISKNYDKE